MKTMADNFNKDNKRVICKFCDSEIELEPKDIELDENGEKYICPCCKRINKL